MKYLLSDSLLLLLNYIFNIIDGIECVVFFSLSNVYLHKCIGYSWIVRYMYIVYNCQTGTVNTFISFKLHISQSFCKKTDSIQDTEIYRSSL